VVKERWTAEMMADRKKQTYDAAKSAARVDDEIGVVSIVFGTAVSSSYITLSMTA
jgi:hypothetical protein